MGAKILRKHKFDIRYKQMSIETNSCTQKLGQNAQITKQQFPQRFLIRNATQN